MRAIDREYLVSSGRGSGASGPASARTRPRSSEEQLQVADYHNFRDNLEPTYLIRLFAEFEAGLREAWALAFRQTTSPRMRDLIDSFAARRLIPAHGAMPHTMSASIATP